MNKSNIVGWFDIYVNDMNRAVKFYEIILKQKLESISDPTSETQMMSFNSDITVYGASGALVKTEFAHPGIGGTLVYFSVEDCKKHESLVEAAHGKVIRPKFSIGKFGYVTLCEDTEGNLFGLSSMK